MEKYVKVKSKEFLDILTELATLEGTRSQHIANKLEAISRPLIDESPKVRTFDGGATRDTDRDKLDYEGFLSPAVIKRYAEYLHKHRLQSDGQMRDSDNWQKGMPKDVYMKSLWRHMMGMWSEHRGIKSQDGIEDAICGVIFNSMGYLYELLKNCNHQEPNPNLQSDELTKYKLSELYLPKEQHTGDIEMSWVPCPCCNNGIVYHQPTSSWKGEVIEERCRACNKIVSISKDYVKQFRGASVSPKKQSEER